MALVRRVDAEHNRELFYALRGGGGGYAIVTAVEIGLLPYAEVTGGALFFAAEDAGGAAGVAGLDRPRARTTITTTFRLLCLPPLPGGARAVARRARRCASTASRLIRPRPSGSRRACATRPRRSWAASAPMPSAGGRPPARRPRGSGARDRRRHAAREARRLGHRDVPAGRRPGSPLLAAELRQLGGALAPPPAGRRRPGPSGGQVPAVRRRHPGAPAPAAELDAFLDRYLTAMRPWATGTRFSELRRADELAGHLRSGRCAAPPAAHPRRV